MNDRILVMNGVFLLMNDVFFQALVKWFNC